MLELFKELWTIDCLIFLVCSIINVALQTAKTIITARGTIHSAAIINCITFGFYSIIVKQLAMYGLFMTVVITMVANLVGVYFSMWLMQKLAKDKLWKISVTTKDELILADLEEYNIPYTYHPVAYKGSAYYSLVIFSETQADSDIIKKILDKRKTKYNVDIISAKL